MFSLNSTSLCSILASLCPSRHLATPTLVCLALGLVCAANCLVDTYPLCLCYSVVCFPLETAINSTTPRGDQPGIALCQSWHTSSTTINYASGGLLEPLAIWNGDYPYNPTSMRKAVMQVNYPYGAAWRNTVLTVMQTESENATFAFQGEAPLMQYNFVLQVQPL